MRTTEQEDISGRALALVGAISGEFQTANDERWDTMTALVRISGEVLPRALGLLEAYQACKLVAEREAQDVYILPHGLPLSADLEGLQLLGVALAPWIALTCARLGPRHREAFEAYRVHDGRLAYLPLPAAGWDEWAAFFAGIERAAYTDGRSQARCYLAAVTPTEDEREAARAWALAQFRAAFEGHRDIVAKAYGTPIPVPLQPTPEEAQTAPAE